MEYVAGRALDQLIPRKGMRLAEAPKIAAQVADAMARALAASGDAVGARKAYEAFFDLWKSADRDVPLLLAARKEHAAIR